MKSRAPSQELLDAVRHIVVWNLYFSANVGKELGDGALWSYLGRSYLGAQLRSKIRESEIEVSHRESRGLFGGKYKLTYAVAHRGAILLEFTDVLEDKTNFRTLQSVSRYHPGEWKQKVDAVYQKILDIKNQEKLVLNLIEELGKASHTPEEVIGLIEATGDPEQTIKLLALSSHWESTCVA